MTQNNILRMYGLDNLIGNQKVKLVRHQDTNRNIQFEKLKKNKELLEEYQSVQSEDRFNCEYILSYLAIENSNSLFMGMYKVKSSTYVENIIVSDNLIELGHANNFTGYKYELEEVDFLQDINNRLVIDWGKGFRSWAQWLDEKKDKEVIEIRPKGYVDDFPGYADVFLDYSELEKIIKYPNANKIWYQKLSAVAGIYLITDQFTGKHYIGSAYGKDGIIGRWKTYVDKSMKENKDLIELSDKNDESYKYKFTFTILRTLSKALTKDEVIEKENSYKRRLGSKEFGLNSN